MATTLTVTPGSNGGELLQRCTEPPWWHHFGALHRHPEALVLHQYEPERWQHLQLQHQRALHLNLSTMAAQ
ncbi:hypothetical protein MTO96_008907 [Rhipicephalus appendiculatus]